MRRWVVVLGAAALVLGPLAESLVHPWSAVDRWLPDLIVGWTLAGAGVVAVQTRPGSRVGALLVAAGLLWFVPNLVVLGGAVGWLASHTLTWHRGPLVHALLSFPDGRLSSTTERVAVVASYLLVGVPVVGTRDRAVAATGVVVAAVATVRVVRSVGADRRAARAVLPAAVAFGGVLVGGALMRAVGPGRAGDQVVLAAYQVTLVAVAVVVAVLLVRGSWERAAVTDLVVALSGSRSPSLRAALGRALGDPTLRLGFATGEGYVDEAGRPLHLDDDGGRSVTRVSLGTAGEVVLLHDPAVRTDEGLLASVTTAAQLAAANARLQAEVRRSIDEVEASRRRLVRAADRERRQIERRLRRGGGQHLERVGALLRTARDRGFAAGAADVVAQVDAVSKRLDDTHADLLTLARGLQPDALTQHGLEAAIGELVAASPVPTALSVSVEGHPSEVDELAAEATSAVYFLCAEALANVAKHARATSCSVVVTRAADEIRVQVGDDGVGGASLTGGSGLLGLADRVEALGGRLCVEERPGGGTLLSAQLPIVDPPA